MELTKDTYLYLTQFADNRTILNMLLVNKKFNNEQFFRQVMENKYPLLLRYKEKQQNWKQFFISMVYCIAKIEETHNIPYYHVEGYNPKNYCNKNKQNILNGIMLFAARGGQIDVVKLMIKEGADNFNWAMREAAFDGYKDIVKLMIQHGATKFNWAMVRAAAGGHIDIVKLMIEKGADDFNLAMELAADGGHIDIVKLMIEKGATDFNRAMVRASYNGHKDIIDLMIEKGANDFITAIEWAKRGRAGQDIVDYLKSL